MNINLTIEKHNLIVENDVIGVATSGGSDSMSLLWWLKTNAERLKIKVVCVNFEHGIRGESSVRDSEFVRDFCQNHGLPLYFEKFDCPKRAKQHGETIEQAARFLRYESFNRLIVQNKVTKIATAHNLNDNAESILMHLFRGCALAGVCGMEYMTPQNIIRPLLDTEKSDILAYLKDNNIPFAQDETNRDIKYTRNFIRHRILKPLEEKYTNVSKKITEFAGSAKDDERFLTECAAKYVELQAGVAKIDIVAHENYPIFSRCVRLAYNLLGEYFDLERNHIEKLWELCSAKSGSGYNLPHGVLAAVEYGKLTLYKNENTKFLPSMFCEGIYGGFEIRSENQFRIPKDGLIMKKCALFEGAEIRNPRGGDIFTPFGGGTKPLNKYLTDKKIPKRLRDTLIVVAKQNIVLAIAGVEISELVRAGEEQQYYTIIKKTDEFKEVL